MDHPPLTMKAMASRLTDAERADIVARCEAGETCGDIARAVGRSPDTVSRVARSIGHRFGATNLSHAHEARSAYCAERRAEIAAKLTELCERLVDEFDSPQPVQLKSGEVVQLELDSRGQKDRAAAAQTLLRSVLDIDRHDRKDDGNASAVDTWLRSVVGDAVADAAG